VTIAICIAVFVLGVAGAVAYRLAHRHDAAPPLPAVTKTKTVQPSVIATDPRAIVREYYNDINNGNYRAAWLLTSQTGGNAGFVKFRTGYVGTLHDYLTIQSVAGNVVTIKLVAEHDNGALKTYQGTYTVTNGVISNTNVHALS